MKYLKRYNESIGRVSQVLVIFSNLNLKVN